MQDKDFGHQSRPGKPPVIFREFGVNFPELFFTANGLKYGRIGMKCPVHSALNAVFAVFEEIQRSA
jgi:hypothetical protein